jgi:hypothetical protein
MARKKDGITQHRPRLRVLGHEVYDPDRNLQDVFGCVGWCYKCDHFSVEKRVEVSFY